MRPSILLLSLVAAGCDGVASDAIGSEPIAIVSHARWIESGEDPFPSHQPDVIDCAPDGRRVEGIGYEIDTGRCNYVLVTQPSTAPIFAGDEIEVAAFHADLAAPQPAQAHVALAIGDAIVWDTEVEIPSDADAFGIRVVAEHDVPAGTPVVFHLHNHGYNTWTLLDVRVHPQPSEISR